MLCLIPFHSVGLFIYLLFISNSLPFPRMCLAIHYFDKRTNKQCFSYLKKKKKDYQLGKAFSKILCLSFQYLKSQTLKTLLIAFSKSADSPEFKTIIPSLSQQEELYGHKRKKWVTPLAQRIKETRKVGQSDMSLTVFPFQASIYLQNRQYYID